MANIAPIENVFYGGNPNVYLLGIIFLSTWPLTHDSKLENYELDQATGITKQKRKTKFVVYLFLFKVCFSFFSPHQANLVPITFSVFKSVASRSSALAKLLLCSLE